MKGRTRRRKIMEKKRKMEKRRVEKVGWLVGWFYEMSTLLGLFDAEISYFGGWGRREGRLQAVI